MPLEITDVLITLIRWIHAMAAVLWIGGAASAFAIHRALQPSESAAAQAANRAYRELTEVAVPIFLLTGAILTFQRFSTGVPPAAYIALLSAKVLLAFGMFHLGYKFRRAGLTASASALRWMSIAGATVVLLATALKAFTEGAAA